MRDTLKIRLTTIEAIGDIIGQPDYLRDYVSKGTITPDGKFLLVPRQVREAMNEQYRPRGLGDYIALVAKRIARGMRTVTGGIVDMTDCGGCNKRQERLNAAYPSQWVKAPQKDAP